MFGVSFLEIALVGLVALVVVGPQKLPEMMRTAGEWVGKLRRMTADMRAQTGIDDILREEGIDGVAELRTLLKGERAVAARRAAQTQAYEAYNTKPDPSLEFPVEGPDARGALPDDLLSDDVADRPPRPSTARAPSSPTSSAQPPRSPASKPKSQAPTPPRAKSSRPPAVHTIPPPPATPRPIPPRAVTHRETPHSKVPKVTSVPPSQKPRPRPPTPPKAPAKSGSKP